MRDYYEILGVAKGADINEVKKAYRNLARKHHPDVDKSGGAEARFKEINEAYQVLSDPKKKEAYDRFGFSAFQGGAAGPGGGFGPFGARSNQGQWGPFSYSFTTEDLFGEGGMADPFDIFESVFGFRGFRQGKGRDLNYVLDIDFLEAVHGGERLVEVGGKELRVTIPLGARSGTKIKFAGSGEPGKGKDGKGLPAGDLYITLRVGPHPFFYRDNDDIYSEVSLNLSQLLLGDTIEVETVQESVKLKVPPACPPGSEFRLKGKGIKSRHGQGDHYLRVSLKFPKNLTAQQRELLEKLRLLGL